VLGLVALAFPADKGEARSGMGVPWFVLAFLGMVALNSAVDLPLVATKAAGQAATAMLVLAVTATGIRSPMQLMLTMGWRSAVPVIISSITALILAIVAAIFLF
jgi:uncharacterized membrane protein YadS